MADSNSAEEAVAAPPSAVQGAPAAREQPQRQAKAPPGTSTNGSASSKTASTSARQNSAGSGSNGGAQGENGQPSTGLESMDAVCNAILTTANTGNDVALRYQLIQESLLPALHVLEQKGTAAGVPGSMILQSPLSGNRDPLQVLMQSPELTGNGVGYLYILCVYLRLDM